MANLKDLDQPTVKTDCELTEENKDINEYANNEVDEKEVKINRLKMELDYTNDQFDKLNDKFAKLCGEYETQEDIIDILEDQLNLSFMQMKNFKKLYAIIRKEQNNAK